MAHGMRHGMLGLSLRGTVKLLGKEGAAWMAGKADWPMLDLPSKPKHALAWLYVTAFQMRTMLGYLQQGPDRSITPAHCFCTE